MKEKHFQSLFTAWINQNPQPTTVFELKICKNTSMPFNSVKDHQVYALHNAKHNHIYHKINDMPIFAGNKMRFTNPKPFDCFTISESKAYIVIWFYKKGQRINEREMIWIDIDVWGKEELESPRKSITEQRAKEIGEVYRFCELTDE